MVTGHDFNVQDASRNHLIMIKFITKEDPRRRKFLQIMIMLVILKIVDSIKARGRRRRRDPLLLSSSSEVSRFDD